jgi:hypothetical protein
MKEAANFLGLVLMLLVMFAMLGLADQQQDLGIVLRPKIWTQNSRF